jgi:hypothetical protein
MPIRLLLCLAATLSISTAAAAVRSTALTDALYPPDWVVTETPERVLGLYAYVALANRAEAEFELAKEACSKQGKPLVIEGRPEDLKEGDQYWLYKTKKAAVVFNQKYVVKIDVDTCTATISRQRFVRSETSNDNWPFPFNTGSMSGIKGATISRTEIVELSARCLSVGRSAADSTVSSECYSVERDLSRGMLLSRRAQRDSEGLYPSLSVGIVDSYAAIDPAIFESNEIWKR